MGGAHHKLSETIPAPPRTDAGRTSSEPASEALVLLRELAAPLLRLPPQQSDRAAEARLVLAIEDQAETLRRRPSDPAREREFASLQATITALNAAIVARGGLPGGALGRMPERLASWSAQPQEGARDEVAASTARGRSGSRRADPANARLPTLATGAVSGIPLQRSQRRSGREQTQPDAPTRPPPLPGTRLATLLGPARAPLELELGKHRLDHADTHSFLPRLVDARTGEKVRARASLLALESGDVLLLTSMVAHGAFGKLRPAILLNSGKEVALKELRRKPSRRPYEPSRLRQDKTFAPQSLRDQHDYDSAAKVEFDLMRRFGGRARSLALHRTTKSNFLVMEAMDGDLSLPLTRARPLRRAALARTLGPALRRQLAPMHAQGFLHLDLRLSNALVYLADDDVSLADFGATCRLQNGEVLLPENKSTYPAPEATARQPRPTARPAVPTSQSSESEEEEPPMLRLTPAADVWSAAVTMLTMLDYGNGGVKPFEYTLFRGAAYRAWYAQALPNGQDFDLPFLANSPDNPFSAMVLRVSQVDPDLVETLLLGPLHPDAARRPTAGQLADELTRELPPTAEHAQEVVAARAERAERQAKTETGQLRAGLRALRADLVGRYPKLLHPNFGLP